MSGVTPTGQSRSAIDRTMYLNDIQVHFSPLSVTTSLFKVGVSLKDCMVSSVSC